MLTCAGDVQHNLKRQHPSRILCEVITYMSRADKRGPTTNLLGCAAASQCTGEAQSTL